MMHKFFGILLLLGITAPTLAAQQVTSPDLPYGPKQYLAYRAALPINVDGRLDEAAWIAAPITDPFVDIQGDSRPMPRHVTHARMLWDDAYLYIAAELEEPDVWATLTRRDTVIFYDNDFEVFIDPDGDTHAYYEFEVNAFGTPWDLMLLKPYREGGPAVNAWDIAGLKLAVSVDGTINRPGDRDKGWSVEIAMPWTILKEAASDGRLPVAGDRWRINFSRVQWQTRVQDGRYVKITDPQTGKPLAEDNWVWSPQGVVNMHVPERWGYVQFSDVEAGRGVDTLRPDPDEWTRWGLHLLYYAQRAYHERHGRYAGRLEDLASIPEGLAPRMAATDFSYFISARGPSGKTYSIREDGRLLGQEK